MFIFSSSEVFYFSVLIYAKLYTTWTFQYHTSIDPRPIYFPLADTDVIFLKLCYILYIYCLRHGWLMYNHDWYWHLDIAMDDWCTIITDIDISTWSRLVDVQSWLISTLWRMVDVQSWLISTSRHRHGWLMCSQDLYWRLYIVMDGWCAIMTAIDV
jgi:hypothetical protein